MVQQLSVNTQHFPMTDQCVMSVATKMTVTSPKPAKTSAIPIQIRDLLRSSTFFLVCCPMKISPGITQPNAARTVMRNTLRFFGSGKIEGMLLSLL